MRQLDKELDIDVVDLHRKEECEHYEGCLEKACQKKWVSFSCQECKKYEQGEIVHSYFPVEDTTVLDDGQISIPNEWRKKSTKILRKMGAIPMVEYYKRTIG